MEEVLDRKAIIAMNIEVLLKQFASDNFPLQIKQRTFETLQTDPESLLSGMRVDNLSGLFCNEPKGFKDDKFVVLFQLLQEVTESLPNAVASEEEVSAFACDYKDPHHGLLFFAAYLMECSNAFHKKPKVYLSPYVSIVQSSMFGKTRLLREVARCHYRTVYVCLRSKKSTGYPPRTEGAFNYLFTEPMKDEKEVVFSSLLADRFKRLIVVALRNLPNPLLHSEAPAVKNERDAVAFLSELIENELWNDNLHKPWTEEDSFPVAKDCTGPSPHLVLLAIDEARYTLEEESFVSGKSLFRHIRQAARLCALDLPNHIRFMIVFVDTSSRIQNFSPSMDRDPSYRKTEFQGEHLNRILFRPHILSHTFDIHFNRVLGPNSTDLRALCDSTEWLNAGRPTMKAYSPNLDDTLAIKLQSGQSAPTLAVDKLAIVLARVGAQVYPGNHYATEMVAGNMATLLDVDNTRESCITTFLSEPALARAAGGIWGDGMLEDNLIPALHEAVISGAFNKGRDGEIVAQIIILMAFDKVCENLNKDLGEVVPLRLVITELLPDDLDEVTVNDVLDRCIPANLKDAEIACVQFVNLCGPLQHDEILQLAERHTGGVLSAGQPGLDLFLPILHSELAAFVIQVKACSTFTDSNYPRSAGLKLRPSVAFKNGLLAQEIDLSELDTNTVRLYMQLGVLKPRVTYRCNAVKRDTVQGSTLSSFPLQIFGVTSRCLSPSLRASLVRLLQDHINWETFIRRDNVKRTGPPLVPYGPNTWSLNDKRRFYPFVMKPDKLLNS